MDKRVALILCFCMVVAVQAGLYRDALLRDLLDEVDRLDALKDEQCGDKRDDCAAEVERYARTHESDLCKDHPGYMEDICPATCKICVPQGAGEQTKPPAQGTCQDDIGDCPFRINENPDRCENHYYKRYCRKSCEECS